MKCVKRSLTLKLVLAIMLLSVLLGVSISFMGYQEFTDVLEKRYNDSAYEIAETAKSYLNPDKFAVYLSTGETDEEYDEILARLDSLVETTDATFIYVATVDKSDYKTLTYIYDSINTKMGYERYELGYTAIGVADKYVNNVKQIINEGKRASEYLYSYSKESGAHTTAGLSVEDKAGNIVAIIGVEKAMKTLNESRIMYVVHVLMVTAIAVVLFLLLYLFYLNKEMIRPLKVIMEEAGRFAKKSQKSTELKKQIHKTDEIGDLAASIDKMESDIEAYIENLKQVTAEKERIGTELSVATQIQADMLPSIFPAFPERKEFDIYAAMMPAREVGGDFYDFFLVDENHIAIVVADVSGKGVPAALFMVIAKTLLKNRTLMGGTPKEILEFVNDQLCENNKAEMFVTVWLGIMDIKTGKITAANAGHEYPVISKANGAYEFLKDKHGFVLAGMEHMKYQEYEFALEKGSSLYLYTDGVTEATNGENELFGMQRLLDALNQHQEEEPEHLLGKVKQHIDAFVKDSPQFDDITMICLKYLGQQELCVDARIDNLNTILEFVHKQLEEVNCPAKVQGQIDIAVEEVFVNIASYAYEQEGCLLHNRITQSCKVKMDIVASPFWT